MTCCNRLMEKGKIKKQHVRFCPCCGKTILADYKKGYRVLFSPKRRGKKLAI